MWDLPTLGEYMKESLKAKKAFPELYCAFDLVQEEDKYKQAHDFAPMLI